MQTSMGTTVLLSTLWGFDNWVCWNKPTVDWQKQRNRNLLMHEYTGVTLSTKLKGESWWSRLKGRHTNFRGEVMMYRRQGPGREKRQQPGTKPAWDLGHQFPSGLPSLTDYDPSSLYLDKETSETILSFCFRWGELRPEVLKPVFWLQSQIHTTLGVCSLSPNILLYSALNKKIQDLMKHGI